MIRFFSGAALAVAVLISGITHAPAQEYPDRPVTIVVPFSAGGPTDALIRTLGNRMRESLGQSIVIENVTGAAGTIGVGRVARAAPDGYTLSFGHWSTHVINGAVYPLPFKSADRLRAGRVAHQLSDVAGRKEWRPCQGP